MCFLERWQSLVALFIPAKYLFVKFIFSLVILWAGLEYGNMTLLGEAPGRTGIRKLVPPLQSL